MRLGQLIRRWRAMEEIGVRDAAMQIGVSHGTLSRIERGLPVDGLTFIKLMRWLFEDAQNGTKTKSK